MNLDNLYISAYIENLCFQFDGTKEDSEAQKIFKELKYLDILEQKDFDELSAFNFNVRAFRHAYNSDTPPEDAQNVIDKYEKSIDDSGLPNRYKLKLYSDLLDYFEKNKTFPGQYFSILSKQISLLEYGDDAALNRIVMQAVIAHRSTSKEVYLKTLQRAYNKYGNKVLFPKRESDLKIKMSPNRKGKSEPTSVEKISKEDLRGRIYVIQDILKNSDLTAAEKISLALEAIALATKTPFHRTKNFEIKRDMSLLIAREYKSGNRLDLAGKYEAEADRWQRSINNAMDKGYERHPQSFDQYR